VEKNRQKNWAKVTFNPWGKESSPILESMLLSQFSVNFANFRRKNFSPKPMLRSQFLQKLAVVGAKNANFFAKFFGENIF
jgi:hypothetical protein